MEEKRSGNPRFIFLKEHFPTKAKKYSERIAAKCGPWRKRGLSISECAAKLNMLLMVTWRGRNWTYANLRRVLCFSNNSRDL